jgi:hypothetical protein
MSVVVMSYLETINALIQHHRGLAQKLEQSRNNAMPNESAERFEHAHELMKDYEFRLVRKGR